MISENIIDYLDDLEIATKGTDLFMGFMPDNPANVVVIRDESAPLIGESQGYPVDSVGVQVLVRNSNQVSARDKVIEIHNVIAGFRDSRFTDDGYPVVFTEITTTPSYIGPDDNNRHTWVVHYAFRIGNPTEFRIFESTSTFDATFDESFA